MEKVEKASKIKVIVFNVSKKGLNSGYKQYVCLRSGMSSLTDSVFIGVGVGGQDKISW